MTSKTPNSKPSPEDFGQLIRQGHIVDAEQLALAWLAESSQNPMAHAVLGFAFEMLGDLISARREYETAIRLTPESRLHIHQVRKILPSHLDRPSIERRRKEMSTQPPATLIKDASMSEPSHNPGKCLCRGMNEGCTLCDGSGQL